MIVSFRHRGLRDLYRGRTARRVAPTHIRRLNRILTVLDQSDSIRAIDVPGFRFHRLSGQLSEYYSITVSGNWRVTFRFEDGHVYDVDYVDYH